MTISIERIIRIAGIMIAMAFLYGYTSKADMVDYKTDPNKGVIYTNEPVVVVEPTTQVINDTIYCSASCQTKSVQVCVPNTSNCTYVDAIYCTISQGNKCIEVFSNFVE
jgi:hypothetical protein